MPLGFLWGTPRFGQSRTVKEPPTILSPALAGAKGAHRVRPGLGTHRCWAAKTAWRRRSGPCLGSQGQVRRSRGSFGPSIMGPLTDRFPRAHFPVCAELPTGPSPLPCTGLNALPAAAGEADPAQRMPVIPLCRLAGVRGHGGGVRGERAWGRGAGGSGGPRSGEGRGRGCSRPTHPPPTMVEDSSGDSLLT